MVKDKIISIEYIGEQDTIDINTSGNRLFYANDILTHNSAMEETEHEMYHIAGGVSKINTADNVLTIYTSESMKQRGEYRIQFIKTRSSSGVGQKVFLKFDIDTMRISDLDESAQEAAATSAAAPPSQMLDNLKRNANSKPFTTSEAEVAGNAAQKLLNTIQKMNED